MGRLLRRGGAALALDAVLALAAAGVAAASPRRRRLATAVAVVAGSAWLAGTAEFAAARIAPGPKTPDEIGRMVATSALIPPLAVAHWLRGWWFSRTARPQWSDGR
jgi:hypothetical protein